MTRHPLDYDDLKRVELFLESYRIGTKGAAMQKVALDAEEAIGRIRERLRDD